MNKSFSDGLKNGLAAQIPVAIEPMLQHSVDYRKGFVCGYAYTLEKLCNNSTIAQYRAGQLACRYQLECDLLADFFSDINDNPSNYFSEGYNNAKLFPAG